jgi:hypothetical protein
MQSATAPRAPSIAKGLGFSERLIKKSWRILALLAPWRFNGTYRDGPLVRHWARRYQARAMSKSVSGKAKKKLAQKPMVQRMEAPDPLSPENIRQMALRLGIPVAAAWTIGGCIAAVSQSRTTATIALAVPGVLTILIAAVVVWAVRQPGKRRVSMVSCLCQTADDRSGARKRSSRTTAKGPAAIFARLSPRGGSQEGACPRRDGS